MQTKGRNNLLECNNRRGFYYIVSRIMVKNGQAVRWVMDPKTGFKLLEP